MANNNENDRPKRNNNKEPPSAVSALPSAPASSSGETASSSSSSSSSSCPQYFLLKSEPHEFSIQQLIGKTREEWDGVRNYAARNHLRSMNVGDLCWFYHSSCATPAIVGTCRVVRKAIPDVTAFQDPKHPNYDPKSTSAENCRWDSVLVEFDSLYETPITLKELRHQAKHNQVLESMMLLKRGRLSVMPVTATEWLQVQDLMERKARGESLLD